MKAFRAIVAGAAVLVGLAATSIVVAQTVVPAIHHGGLTPVDHHARSYGGSTTEHCAHDTRDQRQRGGSDTAPSQPI